MAEHELEALKARLLKAEQELEGDDPVVLGVWPGKVRPLRVLVTRRLVKRCKKARIWGGAKMLSALKNAKHGFDPNRARSLNGRDGVYLLDSGHQPPNAMMRKMFQGYLESRDGEADKLARHMGVTLEQCSAARLVSHHGRLLGVLVRGEVEDVLVLVDEDFDKS